MRAKKAIFLLFFSMLFPLACSKPTPTPLFPDVTVGIAPIVQPNSVTELLAGNIHTPHARADDEEIREIQEILDNKVNALYRNIALLPAFSEELKQNTKRSTQGALGYWEVYAKHHQIDLLIIPFLNYYKAEPTALMLDFFIADFRNKPSLINRYLFAEQQENNTIDENNYSFIQRKNNYSMKTMINDAIDLAFDDFNLE